MDVLHFCRESVFSHCKLPFFASNFWNTSLPSCNAKSVPIIITTICAGREIYPHTNVRDPGKQARGQSQPVHQSQLQPLVDFCSETNVVGRWGQEEEEGARTKTDCWRRHPRLAKCKWQKPCQIHLSDNLCSALNDSTFVLWAANIHSAKETLIKKSDLLDLPLKRGINPQAESFCHRFWAQGWSRNWNYIFVFISIFAFLNFFQNLDGWKLRRRKQSEDAIERLTEIKRFGDDGTEISNRKSWVLSMITTSTSWSSFSPLLLITAS